MCATRRTKYTRHSSENAYCSRQHRDRQPHDREAVGRGAMGSRVLLQHNTSSCVVPEYASVDCTLCRHATRSPVLQTQSSVMQTHVTHTGCYCVNHRPLLWLPHKQLQASLLVLNHKQLSTCLQVGCAVLHRYCNKCWRHQRCKAMLCILMSTQRCTQQQYSTCLQRTSSAEGYSASHTSSLSHDGCLGVQRWKRITEAEAVLTDETATPTVDTNLLYRLCTCR